MLAARCREHRRPLGGRTRFARVQRCGTGRGAEQKGAALLTAMIIVTLIASLAAGMVWQQYRAVQIEAADRARAQSAWILQGALDWARLILKEDAGGNRNGGAKIDHLGEPWAVPLAEARLSTFLAADKSAASDDDGPEAFLSGNIEDAQSRYNLQALLTGPKVPEVEQRVLERLCNQVNAAPNTATLIINGLRTAFPAQAASGASAPGTPASQTAISESGPLRPAGIDQLAWLGVDEATIKRLQPYVVLLPKATPVNLNTAPREVIAALFDGVDLASAERLVQGRKAQPLQAVDDAKKFLPASVEFGTDRASVNSSYFIVTGRLRLDERQLEQRSLIERQGSNMVVLARERINQLLDR
ncbi:type II secretion system minor pseudopilin GspK [Roseateles sp. NT4]|uniref:type II secretion system minor pseudopilin GspK n=1 Tax=Roseateles sp. NT4 TaxID=3453715 RepID=UPI003EF010D3